MFAELNFKKLIKQFDLETLAQEYGAQNLPLTEDAELDAPQRAVVDHLQHYQHQATQQLEQTLHHNRQQLRELEKQMDTSRSEVMVSEARQAIAHILLNQRDALITARLAERQSWRDRQRFKQQHHLERSARYPESKLFHWALVMVAVVLESIANSYFFAKGSDFGLIGGTLQAALISLVNIGTALLVGWFVLPQFNHHHPGRKLLALGGGLCYGGLLLVFSLATAHYRAQLEINPLTALNQTIPTLLQNPWALTHFDAWILFVIGILFALFALFKGYTADDPYPGYGEMERHYQRINHAYSQQKQQLRQAIHHGLTQKLLELENQVNAIHRSASTYADVVARSEQLVKHYQHYLTQCEKTANQLLKHYRDLNTEARYDTPPAYFAKIELFPPHEPQTSLDWQKEHELADNFSWIIKDMEAQAAEQRQALQQLNSELLDTLKAYMDEVEQTADQQLNATAEVFIPNIVASTNTPVVTPHDAE